MKKIILAILLMVTTILNADNIDYPKFVIQESNNNTIHITANRGGLTFEDFKGKAVLLIIFGHNCPPCKAEIPELIEIAKKYKDKLEIVAIEAQGYNKEELEAFKKAEGINYHVATYDDSLELVRYVAMKTGWQGNIPFLIAIDTKGEVQNQRVGMATKKFLEETITKELIK